MTSRSPSSTAQKRRRVPTQAKKAHQQQGSSKATRHSSRIQSIKKSSKSQTNTEQQVKQEKLSSPQQIQDRALKTRKRTRDPENNESTERPKKRLRNRSPRETTSDPLQRAEKRSPEDEVPPSHASAEPPPKRVRTSAVSVSKPVKKTIGEARIDYWRESKTWPTEEQEKTMDRFRDLVNHARARKRSLSRKRSNASLNTETTQTQTPSSQQPRDQKSAPYKHPLFEEQLKECGSFMDDFKQGITTESEKLCQTLLKESQIPPEHTLFSSDQLFKKTCKRIRGENETKVVRDISQLIVPSAEILADRGAEHLEILRETTNACWVNFITFIKPPGSRPGPRPQPDFGLGFKRDAFNREQLQKLQPYIGDPLSDSSLIAATYNMYLPFLSSEVKCGAAALDIADRQNAHTQSVNLRGLHTLYSLVGRENELHREINGFSISHSDVDVRIWGHYAIIDGKDVKFYRHSIAEFNISPTMEGDQRWKAYTFVCNIYDLWLPKHFERICSVIDMLPADLNFDVSELDQEQASSRSALSQQLEDYSSTDGRGISDSQPGAEPSTPDTTIQTGSSKAKKKKTK